MSDRGRPAPARSAGRRPLPAAPMPDAPRRAAFDLLRAVDERDAYANLVLPGLLTERGIEGRDAAFATELAYGTLRGRGSYDAVLAACVDRPLAQLDPPVLDLLRLGAHQLLSMRVPVHAAVGATVELARATVGDGRSSLVNAVLRKVSALELPAWLERVAPAAGDDPVGHLAVVHSHPRWIVEAMRDSLGGSLQATAALLAADNEPAAGEPRGTARSGDGRRADRVGRGARAMVALRRALAGRFAGPARGGTRGKGRRPGRGQPARRAGAGRRPDRGRRHRWLDLCAGPGGKAALLAGLAAERSARLVAAELVARTAPGWWHAALGSAARWSSPTAPRAVAAGHVRPGARRRAVHRPGRAAPPPRGPLAAAARRRRLAHPAAALAADRGGRGRARGWPGRLRHLLAAPRRDSGRRG